MRSPTRIAEQGRLWGSLAYDFYSHLITQDDLVFDVGANVGNRTRVFAQLGRMVVALEPQDSCMRILETQFNANPKVRLIQKAVGAGEGSAEMMISNTPTISSLSAEWVGAVRASGRFSEHKWGDRKVVEVTTLDKLIQTFGVPAFVKIDVEGFEFEVLRGLSNPVKCLSFEFVPEYLASAVKCVERLCSLGDVEFNCSLGESMQWMLQNWVSHDQILAVLSECDKEAFGDVYARVRVLGHAVVLSRV